MTAAAPALASVEIRRIEGPGLDNRHSVRLYCNGCAVYPRWNALQVLGLTRAPEVRVETVECERKESRWRGPVGLATQVWWEGTCPKCGTLHRAVGVITQTPWTDEELAVQSLSMSRGNTQRRS